MSTPTVAELFYLTGTVAVVTSVLAAVTPVAGSDPSGVKSVDAGFAALRDWNLDKCDRAQ